MSKASKDETNDNPFNLPADWLRTDLVQGDLEDFALAFQGYQDAGKTGGNILYAGAIVRSAITAGWLNLDIKADDVAKMHGGKVRWMEREIDTVYREAMDIPKN